ncbi:hypothetical protein [Rubritalea tangerina]|uniref:hypothetical protein n=1 Tax=Rubritalea tangerina TaxID=430798 RepID=UPI003619CBF7
MASAVSHSSCAVVSNPLLQSTHTLHVGAFLPTLIDSSPRPLKLSYKYDSSALLSFISDLSSTLSRHPRGNRWG